MPGWMRAVQTLKSSLGVGQLGGGERLELGRPRQVVVAHQGLEDVRRDDARVEVLDLGRVEARLGDAEGVAQGLGRILGAGAQARQQQGQREQQAVHQRPSLARRSRSMST
jgi:hypothetical protein